MVTINNADLIQELATRIRQQGAEGYISQLANQIVPVLKVEDERYEYQARTVGTSGTAAYLGFDFSFPNELNADYFEVLGYVLAISVTNPSAYVQIEGAGQQGTTLIWCHTAGSATDFVANDRFTLPYPLKCKIKGMDVGANKFDLRLATGSNQTQVGACSLTLFYRYPKW